MCYATTGNHASPSKIIISNCNHNHNFTTSKRNKFCVLQFCVWFVQVVLPYPTEAVARLLWYNVHHCTKDTLFHYFKMY